MRLREIKIEYLMIGILITYIPFHLFEEAFGNFPVWMQQHHWMENRLSYGHWMAGNIFFYYPLLLAGVFLYRFVNEKFLFAGVGVLIWGFMNFLEHSIYSLIDFKVSPGFYSGIILVIIAIAGFRRLHHMKKASLKLLISSFLIAIVYAGFPVFLQIVFSPIFRRIFL